MAETKQRGFEDLVGLLWALFPGVQKIEIFDREGKRILDGEGWDKRTYLELRIPNVGMCHGQKPSDLEAWARARAAGPHALKPPAPAPTPAAADPVDHELAARADEVLAEGADVDEDLVGDEDLDFDGGSPDA